MILRRITEHVKAQNWTARTERPENHVNTTFVSKEATTAFGYFLTIEA